MLKKNDPNKKNRRKHKSKNKQKAKPKPKTDNKDIYDLSTYFIDELVKNISTENKNTFAKGIQRILERAEEKNK